MHARQIGPLNLGAKLYVRKKSQIVFVGAGYRVLLAATDSNQRPVNGPSRSLAAAASHTRRLGSERGICRSGSRGDEEPAGKTCGLPRFHIMHRPPMLPGQDRRRWQTGQEQGGCCSGTQAGSSAPSHLDDARALHPLLRKSCLRTVYAYVLRRPRVPMTASRFWLSKAVRK